MKFRASLRYRVTLSFALLGMVVSLALGSIFFILTHAMEERLIAETLAAELEDFMARYQRDPETAPPSSTTLRTYVIDIERNDIPEELYRLDAGLHRVRLQDKMYYAEVRASEQRRFIVLYDDEQIAHRENQFKLILAIGVALMTVLSALLGFWLSGRVISPVAELATRVRSLRPEDHPLPLSADFPNDEVGRLAREFDAYMDRLAAFIERERSFTADVSHELRTPLAIIEGAIEILADDSSLDSTTRNRLERISRAASEMCELVSALFILAREEKGDVSQNECTVDRLLAQVVDDYQYLVRHKDVQLRLEIQAQPVIPEDCTLLRIVVANIIRNAISFTRQGHILVKLDDSGVTVSDTGIGIPLQQKQRIFDRYYSGESGGEGIGLSLVKRICQRNRWVVTIDSEENRGSTFHLSF